VENHAYKIFATTFALFLITVTLFAGTTGKIAGKVVDKDNDEPLPVANIELLDDAGDKVSGAATGIRGEYFILNIRPGVYQLKCSYQGYNTVTITNVAVSSDRTTTVNFELESSVIEHKEVEIIGKKANVELDVSNKTLTTTAEDIENMPVTSVEEVLETQVGIVEHDGQLHMRGGRSREVTYMVDGMPVTDPTYGTKGLDVAPSSVQEITVQTGSYNAEYGGALSGVVNIITREGDPNKFSGSFSYQTDDFGFSTLNKWSRNMDRLELTLSGPEPVSGYLLPLFGVEIPKAKRISYFASFTGSNTDTRVPYNYLWDFEENMASNSKITTPYVIDYDWYGIFPERRYNDYTATLKLKQRLSTSMNYTVNFSGNWTKSRNYSWDYLYTPSTAGIYQREAYQITAKWTHTLTPRTFYEVRAGYFRNKTETQPGGLTPDEFAVDSTVYASLDDWVDLNGDGEPQVRVRWWDTNGNGQWDFWEYWEPIVDHVDTIWGDAEHTTIDYLDTVFVDDRPPMIGEEPWYEVNDNQVFEPRETNFNSYLTSVPLDRPEPYNDGEPFRDGMPFGMGFYGENIGPAVIVDDTLWVDVNGDGVKNFGEYVWGSYFYNDESISEEFHIALEETTWHDSNNNFIADWGEFVDVNNDGVYTARNDWCDFIDANGNGKYDVGEDGEPFLDLNGNGYYDSPNYVYDDYEPYIDANGNGYWNDVDLFLDRGHNAYAHWHMRETNLFQFKADITSQVDDYNQLKTGLEFQYIHLDHSDLQYPEFKYDREPDDNPYPEHGIFRSFYERTPKQFAWYIQDKMEYGGLIANVGVRLDVFLQAGEVLEDSVSEEILDFMPDEYLDIEKSQSKISPRLGMSYPITERSKLFFSYAHLYQLPGLDYFYQTPNQASRAGRLIGNTNLDYEKTITYELGVGYGITDDWTLEFSGYYKDIYDLINTSHVKIGPIEQDIYKNLDYARSRGIEFSVSKSYSHYYTLQANYQYAFAYGKSSSDRSGYDALFDQTAIPLQDLPLNWDQRHIVNAVFDFRVLEDDHIDLFGVKLPDQWGLNLVFQYGSGFPYTPSDNNPNWQAEPGEKSWERTNALRMPANYNVDLRFNKDFTWANMDYSFFLWVDNLTNRRNINTVYSETGEPDDADIDDGLGNGMEIAQNPTNWSGQRNIRVGLEIRW